MKSFTRKIFALRETRAAASIARSYREYVMRSVMQEFQLRNGAVLRLQRQYRAVKRRRRESAVRIQAIARGKRVRRERGIQVAANMRQQRHSTRTISDDSRMQVVPVTRLEHGAKGGMGGGAEAGVALEAGAKSRLAEKYERGASDGGGGEGGGS